MPLLRCRLRTQARGLSFSRRRADSQPACERFLRLALDRIRECWPASFAGAQNSIKRAKFVENRRNRILAQSFGFVGEMGRSVLVAKIVKKMQIFNENLQKDLKIENSFLLGVTFRAGNRAGTDIEPTASAFSSFRTKRSAVSGINSYHRRVRFIRRSVRGSSAAGRA